jgi:hypothetical protein
MLSEPGAEGAPTAKASVAARDVDRLERGDSELRFASRLLAFDWVRLETIDRDRFDFGPEAIEPPRRDRRLPPRCWEPVLASGVANLLELGVAAPAVCIYSPVTMAGCRTQR